jgi:hypothetical protein
VKWLVAAHRGWFFAVFCFPFFFIPEFLRQHRNGRTVTMSCGEVMMDIDNLILFLVSPTPRLPTDMKSLV